MHLPPQKTQSSATRGQRTVPADRCWGVPIAISATVFFLTIPVSALGLIFVLIVDKFGVTREAASWPENVIVVTTHIAGLPVYVLQDYIRTYHIILLSTIFASMSMVASAFAPSISWMTVTFGAIHGLAGGMFAVSACVYILHFFDKYKSIAMSFLYGTLAITGMISPYVLSFLADTYGLQGAFLLLGGIMMHSTAIVMLAKDPRPLDISWRRTHTACAPSTSDAGSRSATEQYAGEMKEPAKEDGGSMRRAALLFGMPAFYVLVITTVVGDYTHFEFLKTIVDYGTDKGLDRDAAATLLTITSVGQFIGRVGMSILADVIPTSRSALYGLSFLISSACFVALPHTCALSSLAVLSVLQGIMQGYVACIKYVLVAEHVSISKTPVFCGIAGAVLIPITLVSPLITGHFRDARGTYDNYYRMLGAVSLVAAIVFAAFQLWNTCRRTSIKISEPEDTSRCRY